MRRANSVRLATLNTWKNEGDLRRRLPAMVSGLRALAPDVVLLQEVFRAEAPAWHTAQALAEPLGLSWVYAPARRKRRDWDGSTLMCESGLALLWRGTIAASERLPLPGPGEGEERIALLAAGEIRGLRVQVGNVHLSHLRGDDAGRRAQLAAVLAYAGWQKEADLRVIGGDCNATMDLPVFVPPVPGPWRLHDVFAGRPPCPPTFPLPPERGRRGRTIDFLFALTGPDGVPPRVEHAGLALAEPDEGGHWPSDHAAVTADLCVSSASIV